MMITIISFFILVLILSTLTYVALSVETVTKKIIHWLIHQIYKIRIEGQENIPVTGGVLLVANHVSFVDWIIITLAAKRKVRFVMYYVFFKIPIINIMFKKGGAIPIAGIKEDPKILAESFERISEALKNGEIVCIFPEGQLTADGQLSYFRPGINKILAKDPVPVVPIVIKGLWGSVFSRKHTSIKLKLKLIPKQIGAKIEVFVDQAWKPEDASARALEHYYRDKLKFDHPARFPETEE